ncbi:MAG TPA: hypothetical protein VIG33_09270 [Pseudobdellovibrionaceae bacterium]
MYLLYSFVALTLVYLCGDLLIPHLNYLKWDNFEFVIPAIIDAHSLWLEGVVPVWSKFIHLGDPLIGNGQLGVFYFPHTLTLWTIRLFQLPYSVFPFASLLLHSMISFIGWYLILRQWKLGKTISAVAGLSGVFGGMIQFNSQIWTDMLPCWAWFGILILGIERRSLSLVALGISMGGMAAHPQQFFYLVLYGGIWSVVSLLLSKQIGKQNTKEKISEFKEVLWGAIIGLLISLPSILPIFAQKSYSTRAASISLEEFLSRGVQWKDLLGMINPFLDGTASVMPIQSSILLFQSYWVLPGILLGLLGFYKLKKTELQQKFLLTILVGAIALILCMGGNTPLYVFTYKIPLWSSFRWPFKMLYFCLPLLIAAGALGWEMATSMTTQQLRTVFTFSLLLFALSFLSSNIFENHLNPTGIFFLLSSFVLTVALALAYFFNKNRLKNSLWWGAVISSSLGILCLAQTNHNKDYTETYASMGKVELGLTTTDRVLPLSTLSEPFRQQSLGLMHSGPMNNYESAGGCVTALAPIWRLKALPSDVYGVPARPYAFALLKSNLISTMNVGYLIVDKKDLEMTTQLSRLSEYSLNSQTKDSLIFKNQKVLGKSFFAKKSFPATDANYENYVMGQAGTPDSVVVTPLNEEKSFTAQTQIERFSHVGGSIEIQLRPLDQTPQLLVVSSTWYPSWSVYVDQKKQPVLQVNGTLMGVEVPAGARDIHFKWEDPMLNLGFIGFAIGILLWVCLALLTKYKFKLRRKT